MIAAASPNDTWERALDAIVPKTARTQTAPAKRIAVMATPPARSALLSLVPYVFRPSAWPKSKHCAEAVLIIRLIFGARRAAAVRTIPAFGKFPRLLRAHTAGKDMHESDGWRPLRCEQIVHTRDIHGPAAALPQHLVDQIDVVVMTSR